MKPRHAAAVALVVYLLVPPFKDGPDSTACAAGSNAACVRQTFNPAHPSATGGCYRLSTLPRHVRPSAMTERLLSRRGGFVRFRRSKRVNRWPRRRSGVVAQTAWMMIRPSALMMAMRRSVSPGKPSRARIGKNETTPVTEGFRTRFGLRPPVLAVPRPGLQPLLAGRRSPRR